MRRILFIRRLVEQLRGPHPPAVSYRLTKKHGPYRVQSGGRFHPKDEGVVVVFSRSETVDPIKLTDKDAQLAGIKTREELLRLVKRWYRGIPERMYRNWIQCVKTLKCGACPHQEDGGWCCITLSSMALDNQDCWIPEEIEEHGHEIIPGGEILGKESHSV